MEGKACQFCEKKAIKLDYKDVQLLRRFMNSQGKIYPPKTHGLCAKHQRTMSSAIKRARVMALVPFVVK